MRPRLPGNVGLTSDPILIGISFVRKAQRWLARPILLLQGKVTLQFGLTRKQAGLMMSSCTIPLMILVGLLSKLGGQPTLDFIKQLPVNRIRGVGRIRNGQKHGNVNSRHTGVGGQGPITRRRPTAYDCQEIHNGNRKSQKMVLRIASRRERLAFDWNAI